MVKWLRTVDLKVSSSSMFTILPVNLFQCLIDHGKKLFTCRLQLQRGLRNNTELPSLEVWEKGVDTNLSQITGLLSLLQSED